MTPTKLHIIGAGLAGSEAAWQASGLGIDVTLYEMRPKRTTNAHQGADFAELVCSNSFRSDDHEYNAVGLLHAEMRLGNSLIMRLADVHKVPAGGALAVDREGFARGVTQNLEENPRIKIIRDEVTSFEDIWQNDPDAIILVATGPLTSDALSAEIAKKTGQEFLSFFDAIAPIVMTESIDMSKAWRQSRYDKQGPGGQADAYINCPMSEQDYHGFVTALREGPKTEFKEWEHVPYFNGCLPIEVMAERGVETLRFGPLKPVGLTNPHAPLQKPYAVIQLRQDNALGTLYNMVGFQTKLKYGAQAEIFRTIPGLEQAQFARMGGLHRNTFIKSPYLLNEDLSFKGDRRLYFTGQMTGVEGYVESAALGLIAGRMIAHRLNGGDISPPPPESALGALIVHLTDTTNAKDFQPMNINYGLLPPLEAPKKDENGQTIPPKDRGRAKKRLMSLRAIKAAKTWFEHIGQ